MQDNNNNSTDDF